MSGKPNIRIGGDTGQGVESNGAGFCKALARSGYAKAARLPIRPGVFLRMGEERHGMRHISEREGSPYWLVAGRRSALEDVLLIGEDGGRSVLPVFSSEEEARLFLSSCEEGWEAREVSSLELISLLVGEGDVRRVALDPVAGEDPALVSTGWGVFLDSLLGRGRHWFESHDGYRSEAR